MTWFKPPVKKGKLTGVIFSFFSHTNDVAISVRLKSFIRMLNGRIGDEDGEWMTVDKSWSDHSAQLLQGIDRKMSRIESILQQISVDGVIEKAYEIHEMLLDVSQLLLALQQTPLAKRLSLQLWKIQEQYNRLIGKEDMHY